MRSGLVTKTCREIYEFAQREEAALPGREEEARAQTPPRKKAKKKHRMWSVFSRKMQNKNDQEKKMVSNYIPCDHPDQPCDLTCPCVQVRLWYS